MQRENNIQGQHVIHMLECYAHVQNDSTPACSRCAAPQTQGARCPGKHVAFRIPDSRSAESCRASVAYRTQGTAGGAGPDYSPPRAGRGSEGRAESMIVIDASAVLEVLLNS